MALTSAELFAARGDEWNRPNYQFHVDSFYRRTHPDGTREVVDRRLIDGYDVVPDADVPMRATPKPRFVDPKPAPVDRTSRLVCQQLMRLRKKGFAR